VVGSEVMDASVMQKLMAATNVHVLDVRCQVQGDGIVVMRMSSHRRILLCD